MGIEHGHGETASPAVETGGRDARPRLSRRQALGRLSTVATTGAAAWVVPEILTARPAAGASLSGPSSLSSSSGGASTSGTTGNTGSGGVSTRPSTSGDPATTGSPAPGSAGAGGAGASQGTSPGTTPALAFTGLDIKRDAEIGLALIAGGWAIRHWASRRDEPAVATDGAAGVHEAGSARSAD
jgi:hypothetical protein